MEEANQILEQKGNRGKKVEIFQITSTATHLTRFLLQSDPSDDPVPVIVFSNPEFNLVSQIRDAIVKLG